MVRVGIRSLALQRWVHIANTQLKPIHGLSVWVQPQITTDIILNHLDPESNSKDSGEESQVHAEEKPLKGLKLRTRSIYPVVGGAAHRSRARKQVGSSELTVMQDPSLFDHVFSVIGQRFGTKRGMWG
jgi:hypothetical protein